MKKVALENEKHDELLTQLGQSLAPDRERFEQNLLNRLEQEHVRPVWEHQVERPAWWHFSSTRLAFAALFLILAVAGLYRINPFQSQPIAQIVASIGPVSGLSTTNNTITAKKGDTIQTGNQGQASLLLSDLSLVRLDQHSSIQLKQYRAIQLIQGCLFAHVQHTEQDERFQITTPEADVIVLGTEFEVSRQGEKTRVSVSKGRVQVKWNNRSTILNDNESITIDPSHDNPQKQVIPFQQPAWMAKLITAESNNPILNAMKKHFFSRSLDGNQ